MNSTADLRKENMLEILKCIRTAGRVTRPEIAKKTRLTSVTVSTLVSMMVKSKIVLEEGLTDSHGGRKAVIYSFNDKLYNIIGVNINPAAITVDLYDLDGNYVEKGIVQHGANNYTVEESIAFIVKSIQTLLEKAKKDKKDIIGIGALVPGRVDYKQGIVRHLPNLINWNNIPLQNILESELGIPTLVERDTNAHLLFLKMKGFTEDFDSVVYCSFTGGIGASAQIEGKVFHGEHGVAGEVGHTIIEPDGLLCSCGNRGCLESVTSRTAIIESYKNMLLEEDKIAEDYLGADAAEISEEQTMLRLATLANEGDALADKAFLSAIKYLCICIHNIINTYDPGQIIIECDWMRHARKYFNRLVSSVFDIHSVMGRNDVKLTLNPIENIFSVSTSAIVLESLLNNVSNNILITGAGATE